MRDAYFLKLETLGIWKCIKNTPPPQDHVKEYVPVGTLNIKNETDKRYAFNLNWVNVDKFTR